MKHRKQIAHTCFTISLLCLILAGCFTTNPKADTTASKGQAAPLHTAAANTDKATKAADATADKVEKKTDERDSKVKANIVHAREANKDNPDGTPKTVVEGDLSIAESHLSNVEPDPAELAARARDAALVESGKAAEARANYDKAAEQARKDADELAKTKIELAAAIADRDAARAEEAKTRTSFEKQLAANALANQKKIDDALDAARAEMNKKITYALIIGAILSAFLGAFLAYGKFNAGEPIKAAIAAGFWGGCSAFLATCAWALNQWWFKWLVIIGSSVGLVAIIVLIAAELRSAREKKELKQHAQSLDKDATEADSTLLKIYDAVDALPAGDPIFDRFSKLLNDNEKAYLNELKALRQRARATGATVA